MYSGIEKYEQAFDCDSDTIRGKKSQIVDICQKLVYYKTKVWCFLRNKEKGWGNGEIKSKAR